MAIYYVSSLASGSGDGSLGSPFTLSQAITAPVTAGDTVLIMNDGTYYPTAELSIAVTGTAIDLVNYRGCNANGSDDGSIATIDGSNLSAGNNLILVNGAGYGYFSIDRLRLTNAPDHNFRIYDGTGYVIIKNCRIDNSVAGGGVNNGKSLLKVYIFNSEVDHNGLYGLGGISDARGNYTVYNCKVHHNSSYGIWSPLGHSIRASAIYKNGNTGVWVDRNSGYGEISNCIVCGNGGDGVKLNSGSYGLVYYNNIFCGNSGYGVNTQSGGNRQFQYMDYNCFYGNTSGPIDINSGVPLGLHTILADPLFVSVIDESEDYRLQSGSPCINSGLGYNP